MNLEVEAPLTAELLSVYARAGDALRTVLALGQGAAEALSKRTGWNLRESGLNEDPDDSQGAAAEAIDATTCICLIEGTGSGRWWDSTDGELEFLIRPVNDVARPTLVEPTVFLVLDFEAEAPLLNPGWLELLEASGFRCGEYDDTGRVAVIVASSTLADIAGDRAMLTQQADSLADWLVERIETLSAVSAPVET